MRSRAFDAVIGVGGIGAKARAEGIAGKLSWIGIGPHKSPTQGRGPEVTFDHFIDFGTEGRQLVLVAPALAERMYSGRARHLLTGLSGREYEEAMAILELARDAPPSQGRVGQSDPTCPPRKCGLGGPNEALAPMYEEQ
jgi:hypothetical protein